MIERLHPVFPGEATVGEMIRQFWRFAERRRLLFTLQIALSVVGFALTALIPLRIGDLLDTALVSTSAKAELQRFINDPNSVESAVRSDLLPQFRTTAERNAATAAIRATQYQVRVTAADELLDALFPRGLRYSTRGVATIDDPDPGWEHLASTVIRRPHISRSDLEAVLTTPSVSPIERNRAFTYLVNLLLVDGTARDQRADFQSSRFVQQLLWFAGVVLAVFVLRAITILLAARTTYATARRLQDAVFTRVHDTALVESGALARPSMVSRCTSYVDHVTKALIEAQTKGVPDLAALLFSSALLLYIDIPIGLMMIGVIAAFEIVRRLVAPRWSRLVRERLDLNTSVSEVVDSAISRADSVRALRAEHGSRRTFTTWADSAAHRARRLAGVGEAAEVSAFGLGQFSILAAIAIVGFVRKDLSLAEATAVVLYVREVSNALEDIPSMVVDLQEAAPYMRRLRRVLAAPLRRGEPAVPAPLPTTPSTLRLDGVSGSRADGSIDCEDVSLEARADHWTVVCGLRSSGVHHVLDLAAGIDLPTSGAVTLDGTDLASVTSAELRFGVAVLPAFPEVIDGTVRENILWSRGTADEDGAEVAAQAAETAGLGPWLSTLPRGLDSVIGGPRYRIDPEHVLRVHVARVLASTAPLVVLHDPGRHVDREVAEQVWTLLRHHLGGRIVLATTERLDLIHDDDRLYCIRLGTVTEAGSRQQLLSPGRHFAELWSRFVEGGVPTDELSSIPALAPLNDDTLTRLATRLVTERFASGTTIYSAGEPADRVYLLDDGTVDVVDGDRYLTSVYPGFHFGEFELAGRAVRTTSAIARTDVVLRSLHRLAISAGIAGVLELPRDERVLVTWLVRNGPSTRATLEALDSSIDVDAALGRLVADGTIVATEDTGVLMYRAAGSQRRRARNSEVLDAIVDT